MSRLFSKRINNEIKMYAKDNFMFPNVLIKPDETDLKKWYFIIHSLSDDYAGGYYFGIIMLSEEYPLKPPDFKMFTPSGRFDINKKICTSFTGFHSNEHAPSQNILTLSQGVVSFMTDDKETGIGSITLCGSESDKNVLRELRKKYAIDSIGWNKKSELFNMQFTEKDCVKIGCVLSM